MKPSLRHPAALSLTLALAFAGFGHGAEPLRVIFERGRSLPLNVLTSQGDRFTVTEAQPGFNQGQSFPASLASHIAGEKPAEINNAIALLLLEKPEEALKLLTPLLDEYRATAKVSGSYWLEVARATLVANALVGSSSRVDAIASDINTLMGSAAGEDPIIAVGKALLLPLSTRLDDRIQALSRLINDAIPADVGGYASFFKANYLKKARREAEAIEAYLTIPCIYPTGGLILNGVAEMNAAELIARQNRREESIALLTSAALQVQSTPAGEEVEKRLKNLQ